MISPGSRLIWLSVVIVIPFSTLAGLSQKFLLLSAMVLGAVVLVAVLDMGPGKKRLNKVSVQLPELVRLTRFRPGEISILVFRPGTWPVKIALVFPEEIESYENKVCVGGISRNQKYLWQVMGCKTGSFTVEAMAIEVISPLGLWSIKKPVYPETQIRVYPDIFLERKYLSALFRRPGFGIHVARQVGKGRDFEKLREYQPGDDYQDIHWKATAKRRFPVTRIYQVERTQRVYVIIDQARLSGRPVGAPVQGFQKEHYKSILDRYITCSLILCRTAIAQGDRFGALLFSDMVDAFIRDGAGPSQFRLLQEVFLKSRYKPVTPDYDEVFTAIGNNIRRRSLLIFLTHLDDPAVSENFIQNAEKILKHHVVVVKTACPDDAVPLFSGKDIASGKELYKRLGGHLAWASLMETGKTLNSRGIGFGLLTEARMCAEIISSYLEIKRRQLL